MAVILLSVGRQCLASFIVGTDISNYGILFEGAGGNQLSITNDTVNGNIGIGSSGSFSDSGPGALNGLIEFAAADAHSSSQYNVAGNVTLSPTLNNPSFNVTDVAIALGAANSLSQTLGRESGTAATIAAGGSVTATNGILDSSGNRVFTASISSNFTAGSTFTVNGSASDFVVLNLTSSGVGGHGLDGSIVLSGGITSDHVLINYTPDTNNLTTYNADYTNLTGGPTLQISANGNTTSGVFLDPTGSISVDSVTLDGRLIGGDTHNLQFVSGANLNAPPSSLPLPGVIPGTLLLLGGVFVARKIRSGRGPSHV